MNHSPPSRPRSIGHDTEQPSRRAPLIRIVNVRHEECDVYIGRANGRGATYRPPSPFANPFATPRHGSRDQVIEQYEDWLEGQLAMGNLHDELNELVKLACRPGGVSLGCWCAPKNCHGHVLARFIEKAAEHTT